MTEEEKQYVETTLRAERQHLNANAAQTREEAMIRYGMVWNTEELQLDFEVVEFAAPYVVVKRKSDGKMGSLQFQHDPRFYFRWEEA